MHSAFLNTVQLSHFWTTVPEIILGSSDIWSDGKYAFISQASGGRYNERSEWSITLYTVT